MNLIEAIENLENRMNGIRKWNRKHGDTDGNGFANGIDFCLQTLKETNEYITLNGSKINEE